MYTNYTMYHQDDDNGCIIRSSRPKQKYSIGEIVDVNSWTGMEYGFEVVDIEWIYHYRLNQYCWGYRVYHPEGKRTGLTFTYIPEGYLRKHEQEKEVTEDDPEIEDILKENENLEDDDLVEDKSDSQLKPGFRFINYSNIVSAAGDRVCLGLDGKPVERGPNEYPYSYDPFVVFKSTTFDKSDSYVYSDRMMQRDYDKFAKACNDVWGNTGQMFHSRTPEEIERFLSIYFDKEVELTLIMECCNAGNGYPYWLFALRGV